MQMYVQEVEDLKAECSRGDFLAKVFNNFSLHFPELSMFETH